VKGKRKRDERLEREWSEFRGKGRVGVEHDVEAKRSAGTPSPTRREGFGALLCTEGETGGEGKRGEGAFFALLEARRGRRGVLNVVKDGEEDVEVQGRGGVTRRSDCFSLSTAASSLKSSDVHPAHAHPPLITFW
jgi:hypothetical protein